MNKEKRPLFNKKWQTAIYIIVSIVVCLAIVISGFYIVYRSWYSSDPLNKGVIVLRGQSMEPTFKSNSIVYTKPWTGERGELVVFVLPSGTGYQYAGSNLIKRIIGLPGEAVEIKEEGVFINGELLEENYTDKTTNINERNTCNAVFLSDNRYFVMGDNRSESYDSRAFGDIQASYIQYAVTSEPNEHTNEVTRHCLFLLIIAFIISMVVNCCLILISRAIINRIRYGTKKKQIKKEKIKKQKPIKEAKETIEKQEITEKVSLTKAEKLKLAKRNRNVSKKKIKRLKKKSK